MLSLRRDLQFANKLCPLAYMNAGFHLGLVSPKTKKSIKEVKLITKMLLGYQDLTYLYSKCYEIKFKVCTVILFLPSKANSEMAPVSNETLKCTCYEYYYEAAS